MALKDINGKYVRLATSIGKGAITALFPKDFETYMLGLELCDSNDNTIDYFAFPVMPESITKSEPKRVNIKSSSSGVTVLSSNSFLPEEISIKGNFGRSFKMTLSPIDTSVQGFAFSARAGKFDLLSTKPNYLGVPVAQFLPGAGIKTGYGAHSLLRSIISKSNGVDASGKPFKMYFYNMAMGESYLVSAGPQGFTSSQNMDKNMIWDYNLTLTVLAPLSALKNIKKKNSMLKLLAFSAVQQGAKIVGAKIKDAIKEALT